MVPQPTLSIAIPTYHRPAGLDRALRSARDRLQSSAISSQVVEVLVIDNSSDASAATVVDQLAWPLARHVHEPLAGVAMARNRALEEAAGDVLVFFDDDERVGPGWPDELVATMLRHGAAITAGPVRSQFATAPPDWVRDLGFFERPDLAEGTELDWVRSGNLAIDLGQTRAAGLRFDPAFNTGGEDVRFTTLVKRAGLDVRWCSTAIVFEDVEPERITESWVVERARTAAYNYTRARAPLPPWAIARTLVVASIRICRGAVNASIGTLTGAPGRSIRGRAERSRGRGSLDAVVDAVRTRRDP